jgi:hypothetical protein
LWVPENKTTPEHYCQLLLFSLSAPCSQSLGSPNKKTTCCKYLGANHGKSYFFFFVGPGEHRLCAEWQSSFKRFSKLGSATSFTTEAGKTYHFRTEVEEREKYPAAVKLEMVNSAEGQFLISGGALSRSCVKPMEPPEQE